jgi:multidrug resistance efflux pump
VPPERKSVLVKSGAVTASDTDDARAAYETALADATAQVASQEAPIQEAKTQLAIARSRVAHSETRSGTVRQRSTRPKPIWIAP